MNACQVDGCDLTLIEARGMCDKHYTRWLRHGDPLVTHGPGNRGRMGSSNGNWKGDAAPYSAIHLRLVREFGSASQFQCLNDCGRQAQEWAYDHGDPNEIVGDDSHGVMAPYSLDPQFYMPLCKWCHRSMDAR